MGQPSVPDPAWVAQINAVLPQTQCTRCGEPDCAGYAGAVATGASINRCPPGGAEGMRRLAALTGRPAEPLDPTCGNEGPRRLAWVDEAACIGCTLCIKACPVDCIVGAPQRMHTIVEDWCTGCELCIPACPVDCIHLDVATPGLGGWAAWSEAQAGEALHRYSARTERLSRAGEEERGRFAAKSVDPVLEPSAAQPTDASFAAARHATIAAAVAKARALKRA